jgi:TolB-like protein
MVVAAIVILAASGFLFWRSRSSQEIDSLAVLPFQNAGGGEEAEWLSDGMTDSVIGSLAQAPGLRVKSRNAVNGFKGKDTDAKKAANQLGVRGIVTGRVKMRGDRLSVTAELVDARDGSELWGENYDRAPSEIIVVEKEIAAHIA